VFVLSCEVKKGKILTRVKELVTVMDRGDTDTWSAWMRSYPLGRRMGAA
jgi:hypothetical protein